MHIPNLDYDCFVAAKKAQHEHQEDWLKTGYAPKGFYLKDFCLIRAEKEPNWVRWLSSTRMKISGDSS